MKYNNQQQKATISSNGILYMHMFMLEFVNIYWKDLVEINLCISSSSNPNCYWVN